MSERPEAGFLEGLSLHTDYVFVTTGGYVVLAILAVLTAGLIFFLIRQRRQRQRHQ
jgi:hypothetical protein